ncbi:hypothetical protein C0J52_00703, partial [Blattella germanica]
SCALATTGHDDLGGQDYYGNLEIKVLHPKSSTSSGVISSSASPSIGEPKSPMLLSILFVRDGAYPGFLIASSSTRVQASSRSLCRSFSLQMVQKTNSYFKREAEAGAAIIDVAKCQATACSIGIHTVQQITGEARKNVEQCGRAKFLSPAKNRSRKKQIVDLDDFNKDVLRRRDINIITPSYRMVRIPTFTVENEEGGDDSSDVTRNDGRTDYDVQSISSCLCPRKSPGNPQTSEETVYRKQAAYLRSPKMSTRKKQREKKSMEKWQQIWTNSTKIFFPSVKDRLMFKIPTTKKFTTMTFKIVLRANSPVSIFSGVHPSTWVVNVCNSQDQILKEANGFQFLILHVQPLKVSNEQ